MIPTATITTFLPLLAERSVRNRIRTRPPASLLPPLPASIEAATDGEHGTSWKRADDVVRWRRDGHQKLAMRSTTVLPGGAQ